MNTAVNLLPDDLRRRTIRVHVIRIWTPILLTASIVIAVVSHLRWMKCEDLAAQVENAGPRFQTALTHLHAVEEFEETLERLKAEQRSLTQLKPSSSPLTMLQIVSQSVKEFSDQMRILSLEVTSDSGQSARPESQVLTSVQGSTEPTQQYETIRVIIRGEAVSDAAVARFLNTLRNSGGYQSVRLKSSNAGAGTASGLLLREFSIECQRMEARL